MIDDMAQNLQVRKTNCLCQAYQLGDFEEMSWCDATSISVPGEFKCI